MHGDAGRGKSSPNEGMHSDAGCGNIYSHIGMHSDARSGKSTLMLDLKKHNQIAN